jgi:hypothetical protein
VRSAASAADHARARPRISDIDKRFVMRKIVMVRRRRISQYKKPNFILRFNVHKSLK